MASRGITRVKHLEFKFCDWGGSSRGMREFFETPEFYSLVNSKPQCNFNFLLARFNHPMIRATYLSGFKKNIDLKNLSKEEIQEKALKLFEECKIIFYNIINTFFKHCI